jgi:CBS domain-containing protein
MTTVKQILNVKGTQVWSIPPDAKIFEALELMAEKGVGALLVMEGEDVVGIVSERDYARKVILLGKSSKEAAIREIMTSKLIVVSSDDNVEECMAIMTNKRVRHLPVMNGNKLVGVISIGDVVKSIISEQGILINHLTNYITGK